MPITFTPAMTLLLAMGLILLEAGCTEEVAPPQAQFVVQIPWAEKGVWLKADLHAHSRFSDGSVDCGKLVDEAVKFGCDVFSVTDHGDPELRGVSQEYFDAVDAARVKHPQLVLLDGMEWNIPPWEGREHVTMLATSSEQQRKMLRDFRTLFDDWKREFRDSELALKALDWLEKEGQADSRPVLIFNHPSRKRELSESFASEFALLQKRSPLIVGFEGAPGHQNMPKIGAYKHKQVTEDRWDPTVAKIGGDWDQLLQQGVKAWAAVASSDFHARAKSGNADDFWPGEFSETWIYASDRSPEAVLQALRAGSFFAAHGHIVRDVQLKLMTEGLPRPAMAGETVQVPVGQVVKFTLELTVPERDWLNEPNKIDEVEFIAITSKGAESMLRWQPGEKQEPATLTLTAPEGGLTMRARGRRIVADGPDLLFYTNSIRIVPPTSQ